MGAKGIDIFRVYQHVFDWSAVRESGVEYCWIKATDGLRIATFNADKNWAPAPADPTVEGARSVGIAPGLYHWGKGNDPEAEAEVFAAEVIRLGCLGPGTLPPALDAEDGLIGPTWDARRTWCIAFLRHLQRLLGQDRVAIYMNASWAQALRPDQWDIPGLVIWIAAYGTNNGKRSTGAITQLYPGHYDVHQFTSLGLHLVAGIESQGLDVNEADTPLDQLLGGSDVELSKQVIMVIRPDTGESWPELASTALGYATGTINVVRDRQVEQAEVLNVMMDIVRQIAENDDRVTLSPEQLAAISTTVSANVSTDVSATVADALDRLGSFLADKLGTSKDVVHEALREFYGDAVNAA